MKMGLLFVLCAFWLVGDSTLMASSTGISEASGESVTTVPSSNVAAVHAIIRDVYVRHMEREPDPAGLEAYTHKMRGMEDAEKWLTEEILRSPEARQLKRARRTARWQAVSKAVTPFKHVVISLVLAIFVGFVISQVYKHTHRGMNFELSFMSTLVLLAPIVTLVMLYIRGDLVLSLGLIGSLSIIRFRTPIKDTRDMIFLFWTIAVGLGAGTYNWMVVLISSIIMVPLVFVLYFVKYGRAGYADFILICSGTENYPMEQIHAIVNDVVKDAVVRSHEVSGDIWETVFELRRSDSGAGLTQNLVLKLKSIKNVSKVSLLSPKLDLPV